MKGFRKLLAQYPFNKSNEGISEEVKAIIDDTYEKNDTIENKKFLFGSLELTTLKPTDNEENVAKFVEKVNNLEEEYAELPLPSAICVYPSMIDTVRSVLTEDIDITTVIGFPSSQTFSEIKIAETALSVNYGATEIDMVLPVGKFMMDENESYEEIFEEIQEIKDSCQGRPLKVILETGVLDKPELIHNAAILAMEAGADFIKSTTGKEKPTTMNAVFTMCHAINAFYENTNEMKGLKIAGGISTTTEALAYYSIVKDMLGEKWLNQDYFRIGASRLANDLIKDITGEDKKYF